MKKRVLSSFVAVALATTALAGCGSSGGVIPDVADNGHAGCRRDTGSGGDAGRG